MLAKKYISFSSLIILVILLIISVVLPACNLFREGPPEYSGVQTELLVKPPDKPLPVNQPVEVRSRTEDTRYKISHVELYAAQLPSGQSNVLIRSDPAPSPLSSFTARQSFTPLEPGHYIIKVVGYNRQGDNVTSDSLGFDVE